jgi:hypothetical protein
MSGGPVKPKFLVLVSLLCLLAIAPCSAQRRHSKKAAKPEPPAVEAAPAPPPPTLAQMPASPPQVSFQGGQLTIAAQNSTLGDILKAVRAQTGATVDFPGNASERVVGNFGPAPARDVLTSLLNGSHFNYLLLGSATDPTALDRVILTAKSGSSASGSEQPSPVEQAAFNQPAYPRPMTPVPAPGGNSVVVEGQDAQDDATDDAADATDDTQADDQTDQTDQTDQADDQTAAEDQQQQQQDGQPAVKTPEQLLQQLQQRQQQLQQQGIQPGMQPGVPPGFPNPGIPGQPGVGTQPHN